MALSFLKIRRGQSLVELMLAIGISAIMLPALLTGLVSSREGKAQQIQRTEASSLLKQTDEAIRSVREKGWTAFAVNGTYHLATSGSTWILASGSQVVSGYTKSVVISDVYRDNSGNIVSSSGTLDPSTKKIVSSVSWSTPVPYSVTTTSYLTRYLDNLTDVDTTQAEFDQGVKTGVATTSNSGGEVVLSGGGHGDWCQPNLTQWGFNLNHNASGTSISAIEGHAFVVTGNNNASETFYDVIISDTYPPTATSAGVLAGQKKAYGVFGDSTYAYIATDTRQKQGAIINLSNHQEVSWLDLQSSSVNGRSIVVSGNYAYLSATDNKIYIFDISTKTGTHTPLTNVSLSATALKIVLIGNNLYAALNAASNQLAIIPVTGGGSSFASPSYVSVTGQNGRDVFVNSTGTRAYLAVSTSSSQKELFIIDTNPVSATYKQVLASEDTNGMDPFGVIAVTNNKVIIVGTGGYEYQVYTYDGNNSISTCPNGSGFLNIDSGVKSVSSVIEQDGDAYSYLLTGDGTSEFKIIEGGPSGKSSQSGTFESRTFSFSFPTAFNHLSYTANLPGGTNISFQVAVSGDCVTYSYVDLGSTGAIPFDSPVTGYQNPGPCFRYKAYLSSTNPSSSPTLYDVTVNYSP